MQALLDLIGQVRELQQLTLLGFARGLGAFSMLPLFAAQFPRQVRLAPAIAALPAVVWSHRTAPLDPGGIEVLVLWALAEFLIGALLTLPVGLLFWAAQSAGELIDIKTGANNSAVFGSAPGAPEGPAQIAMTQLAVLGFLAGNGLQSLIQALWRSYEWIPLGGYAELSVQALPALVVQLTGQLAGLTLQLFGPFLVVFLLVEFGIGLMGKFASQLQVSTIAAPLKSLLFPLILLIVLQWPGYLSAPVEAALTGLQQAVRVLTTVR